VTTTVLAFIPSPSQGVWHLGFVPLRAYALCIIAGIVAALVLGDRRWEARGGERGVIYDVALWAVPFGLIGGRLYHVITDSEKYFGPDGAGFLAALRIWDGGLGIWGAVALGGVGAWIACRRRGIPLPAFGDAIAPGIILAQAIGRLGNYFNQELYGRETDLPWGLTIYERLDPSGVISPHSLDGVSTGQVYAVVHPTFLYELLWNLLIFAVLIWADRRFKLGHGRLFALYVAGYCVGRFWVELMRSDTATLIAGIRVNSFTSTFVFIGAVIYIMVAPKGRDEPSTLRGKDLDESRLDEFGEELVAVAATSGVVAAVKVAGDEDRAETESTGGADTESEAAAEAEDLTEKVETAPSEDIAEAESFAAAGAEADEQREAGLGSVEGDEAVEAEVGAPEAHEAAVDGAAEAESLAEEVTAEPESPAASEDAAPEADEATATPVDGLGSVDGDEVEAAEADATEVHEAAVEATASAEATADDVATAEPESPDAVADAAPETSDTADETAEVTPPTDESTATPEDGVGSVDADEGETAADDSTAEQPSDEQQEATPEIHEAADDSADSAEAEADVASEGGLGSVDGDEVEAAAADATEVHDAAVEGAESAEATADDLTEEPESPATEADAAPASGETTEESAEATPASDESTASPEDGLGSVDGDEVEAAEADATEVHEAAVEGTESAEATADDVAAEEPESPAAVADAAPETSDTADETAEATPASDESTATPENGLDSAEAPTHKPSATPQAPTKTTGRRWWRRS
jgi:prolipoprotein diacylglyceryl transferase